MFAQNLKALRTKCDLSQKDLANLLYVSQQTVAKWEVEKSTPNPDTLIKIASILKVTVDELIGAEVKEKPATVTDDEPFQIPGYDKLTPANRAAIDQLIEHLLKSQSGE